MSAIDDFKKELEQVEVETPNNEGGSFQYQRTSFIEYLESHRWIGKKECEYLKNRTNQRTHGAFSEKGKGWALIDMGTEILKRMYK